MTLMILENIIGPDMGAGCPDRAVSIMTQWSVFDDRFHAYEDIEYVAF